MTSVLIRKPSLTRFRDHILHPSREISVLRCLEYERLPQLGLAGRILDFGGGTRINYVAEIDSWRQPDADFIYESANIDPTTEPTHLLSGSPEIPVVDGHYDAALALNTFEHIFSVKDTLIELNRVLRRGARLHFIVPFIFRVHGHPDDYLRGTPSFWERLLTDCQFEHIEIEALTWGPTSTALSISGAIGPFKRLRQLATLLFDIFYVNHRYPDIDPIIAEQDEPVVNTALAYLVSAAKA